MLCVEHNLKPEIKVQNKKEGSESVTACSPIWNAGAASSLRYWDTASVPVLLHLDRQMKFPFFSTRIFLQDKRQTRQKTEGQIQSFLQTFGSWNLGLLSFECGPISQVNAQTTAQSAVWVWNQAPWCKSGNSEDLKCVCWNYCNCHLKTDCSTFLLNYLFSGRIFWKWMFWRSK